VIDFLKSVVALRICQAGKTASKKLSYSVAHARAGVCKTIPFGIYVGSEKNRFVHGCVDHS
jgi:hypothetical protein